MSEDYSEGYKTFSESLLKANRELIAKWADDTSNPELQESCRMLMDAAGAEK